MVAVVSGRRPAIALMVPNLHGGGAQRITLPLVSELQRLGLETDLVVGAVEGPLVDEVPGDISVVDLGAPRLRRALRPLVRYLQDRQPAVLMPTIPHTDVLAAVAGRMSRTGVTVIPRVSNTLSAAGRSRALNGRLSNAMARWVYTRAPLVIACSWGMQRDLVDALGVPADHVEVAPNAAVGAALHRLALQPVDHPWVGARDVPLILAVGSLTSQKNHALLLESFADLLEIRPAHLLVLGEGPLRRPLGEQVARLGISAHVEFAGFDVNPYRYMRACDLFVLSSDWEGLPGVLIEAVACGANVVSTDCPSGPAEILGHGAFGRLVPCGDRTALATALGDALDDPIRPGPDAWERYTVQAAAQRYAEIVGPLLDRTTVDRRTRDPVVPARRRV